MSIASSFVQLEKNAKDISEEDICIAKGCVYGLVNKKLKCNLPRRFQVALKDLRKNPRIHLTKADKSNAVVILDKEEYVKKLDELLSDENTYCVLRKNPTAETVQKFNSTMKRLLKGKPDLEKSFSTVNPNLPYMYGLVKTHKENNPLRPVISSVGSVSSKLSKWLGKMLSPLIGTVSSSHVKNTGDLLGKLKNHNVHCNLISFDVNSLFTRVPVQDFLDYLKDVLINLDLPVSVGTFINLIKLCVFDNVFTANGKFYKQTFGCAMGNSLSPVISTLYMEFFESRLLPHICNFELPWFRYVDDILCLWPVDRDPSDFLLKLNGLVPSISFKLEKEVNGCLPFLDTLIIRSDNGFKFKVYKKPTHVDSYIHFTSNHHRSVKRAIFSGMFLRALRICSPEYLDEEFNNIKEVAKKLCYPEPFIDYCLEKAKRRYYNSNNNDKQFCTKNMLILPYHEELTDIVRLLKPLNINVMFKYENTIKKKLIKNSPHVDESRRGCVYSIGCKNCNQLYIGQTGKFLEARVKQHKYAVRTGNESSAIFKHVQ